MTNPTKKKPSPRMPVSIPQPHGGALLSGGVPGHVGGGGRPKNEVRRKLGEILEDHGPKIVRDIMTGTVEYTFKGVCSHCGKESERPTLDEFAEHLKRVGVSPDTRLRAVDSAAKIALGEKHELTLVSPDIVTRLTETLNVLNRELPKDLCERVVAQLHPIWSE